MRKPTLKSARKRAWQAFSEWVRRKGICYTCGARKEPSDMHAGHFRHNKLDFDAMNVKCQCKKCNTYLSGNLGIFGVNLIREYGQEAIDDLIMRSNQPHKYTIEELLDIEDKYKNLLKEA